MSRFGLSCAIATPFDVLGDIDAARLVAHARDCLARGCDSITVFGTTGEGASIGLAARGRVFDALSAGGVTPRRLLGCVAAASIEDAADQARMATDAGVCGVLLTPPFYFRRTEDEALFRWFARLFERLGGAARDIFVYHLPDVTGVPLSIELIGRLKREFPGIVVGVKDSSGSWPNTEGLLAAHSDLMILVGEERHLARAVQMGGAGSICGLANLLPELLAGAARRGIDDPRILRITEALDAYPFVPAVKALIAHQRDDETWRNVRPPLATLPLMQATELIARYVALTSLDPASTITSSSARA